MKHLIWASLALACAAAIGSVVAAEGKFGQGAGEAPALQAPGEQSAFARRADAQRKRLERERVHYPVLFRYAYSKYPRIPAGTLEALAYAQSGWHSLRPDRTGEIHDPHSPQAWGVMGLYNGGGFADQVGEAAALLGVTPKDVRENPKINVLAAAALLNRAMSGTAVDAGEPATLVEALQRYAGFGQGSGQVDAFSRAMFAKDVLQALDFGVNDNGIRVPERAVAWEQGFSAGMLAKLRAPMLRVDSANDSVESVIETEHFRLDPVTGMMVDKSEMTESGDSFTPDIPGVETIQSGNYGAGKMSRVTEVIQHTTESDSFSGMIEYFKDEDSDVSPHYLVGKDGRIVQMVKESDVAYHAREHNYHAIGIEHIGYAGKPDTWTEENMRASALITRHVCAKYAGVSCANAVNDNDWKPDGEVNENVAIKGHGMVSGAKGKTDPGPYFDWENYYKLINPGVPVGKANVIDPFESGTGHFKNSPAYAGSTTGIAKTSSKVKSCEKSHAGKCSLKVALADDKASPKDWAVRLLSGSGDPAGNVKIPRASQVGFWVWSSGGGMSVGVGIDDGASATERSVKRKIPAGKWVWVDFDLRDEGQWLKGTGGNGKIDNKKVTLDAIWLYRAQSDKNVALYIDNVQYRTPN